MAEQVKNGDQVKKGDVLLVTMQLVDKKTKEPFTWRWFGVIVTHGYTAVKLMRLDAEPAASIHNPIIRFADSKTTTTKLEPEEWPPGVHALYMAAILDGKLDI